ncbi:MAG: archaemetzincin family Zn-dependent metalloprotease [Deltaproteobacteria bacterium]|nr:archaemetzincin family Zn-dependent metalloprotease [Deltaproteobacteria bacterium]
MHNLIAPSDHSLVISVNGDFKPGLFESVRYKISRVFRCPTIEVPLLQDLDFAFDQGRKQYHSTLILEELAKRAPASAIKVLAITDVDLFIPVLTYVYGEAQLNGKACIISTFRLKEGLSPMHTQDAFLARVFKEAFHELGHTFNLLHCPDHACIMHYCRSEQDVDRKSEQLCRYCGVFLEDALKRVRS